MKKLHALLFVVFILFGHILMAQTQANPQDSLGLVAIYNNTNGPRWTERWNLNAPVRTWPGIDLNGNGDVLAISLPGNNIQGTFGGFDPSSQLTNLQNINLTNNFLTGISTLPASQQMQSIELEQNKLSLSDLAALRDVFGNIQIRRDSSQKAFGPDVRVSAVVGDSVTVSVEADNSGINNYEWRDAAGNIIQRGPSNSLLFPSIEIADSGLYQVTLIHDFPGTVPGITYDKPVSVLIRVDTAGINYESARDSTGRLRAILYLPLSAASEERRAYIKDTLLPSYNIIPIGAEACLCDEYSMYHFPDTLIDSEGNINIGPQSLINSACGEIEPEGGDFGYDFALDSTDTLVTGTQLNIQLDTNLVMTGLDTVTVAVIDLGIDNTHFALENFLYGDDGKISCMENDSMGYNFYAGSSDAFDVVSSHGTHVAGIITGFLPDLPVKIMSVQVGKTGKDSRLFDVICGIKYANLQEVDLINLSMGYSGPESNLLRRVIMELPSSPANTRLVTSAGNKGDDMDDIPSWPAAYGRYLPSYVVTVGAMNLAYDSLAKFSNHSNLMVGIAAPGTKIYSTINGGVYGYMDGTSMAAPFVTAVLAFMKSAGLIGPTALPGKLIQGPSYAMDEINLAGKVNSNKKLKVSIDDCMDIPFARDDYFQVQNGQDLTFDVRRNDCPASGIAPSIVANVDPGDGSLVVNADGTISFTPLATDKEIEFTYELCSASSVCTQASVTLGIGEVPIPGGGGNYWWWIIALLIILFILAYFVLNNNS